MSKSALFVLAPLALASASCGGSKTDSGDNAGDAPPVAEAPAAAEGSPGVPARPDVFVMCASCHQVEPGKHAVGPSLAGVFGAKAGAAQGYTYSSAMKDSGLTWDEAALGAYLESPMKAVPGTKMTYAGLKNPQQREQVIAYLKGL